MFEVALSEIQLINRREYYDFSFFSSFIYFQLHMKKNNVFTEMNCDLYRIR